MKLLLLHNQIKQYLKEINQEKERGKQKRTISLGQMPVAPKLRSPNSWGTWSISHAISNSRLGLLNQISSRCMQKLVKHHIIGFTSMIVREHQDNHSKESKFSVQQTKFHGKSREKSKKVLRMIFLGSATRYIQFGLRESLYPLK